MKEGVTTSRRAAAVLRQRILSGALPPGTPLREAALIVELRIARNTLREAFQQLLVEGLTEYKLYKGTVVRRISADELVDIYLVRRTLELQAIAGSAQIAEAPRDGLRHCIAELDAAVRRQDWPEVGTASLHFHQAIVGLLGSSRLNAFFEVIAAQLRLAFSEFRNEAAFQLPWVMRDKQICELICAGRDRDAVTAMAAYLSDSERQLLEVLKATGALGEPGRGRRPTMRAGGKVAADGQPAAHD
jgi:DNA-binding GntR family transcriptional regulator